MKLLLGNCMRTQMWNKKAATTMNTIFPVSANPPKVQGGLVDKFQYASFLVWTYVYTERWVDG